jgi:acyl-CoA dehydrogenase family member 9
VPAFGRRGDLRVLGFSMTEAELQRQKEMQQAEELLFTGPQALGFVKGLFAGHFVSDWVMPYPRIPVAQQTQLDQTLQELRAFLDA